MQPAASAAERRARIALALSSLPAATGLEPAVSHVISGWMADLPAPSSPDASDVIDFELAVHGELLQATIFAAAPAARLGIPLRAILVRSAAPKEELARIARAGADLKPRSVGVWLKLTRGVREDGWSLDGDMPLLRALAHAPQGEPAARVASWAAHRGLTLCQRLRRSIGGERRTELLVPLAADDRAPLVTAAEGLSATGHGFLSGRVLAVLQRAQLGPLAVSFTLKDDGAACAALVVNAPATRLVLEFAALAGVGYTERFATLEAALDAAGPTYLAYRSTDHGSAVELYYQMMADR